MCYVSSFPAYLDIFPSHIQRHIKQMFTKVLRDAHRGLFMYERACQLLFAGHTLRTLDDSIHNSGYIHGTFRFTVSVVITCLLLCLQR